MTDFNSFFANFTGARWVSGNRPNGPFSTMYLELGIRFTTETGTLDVRVKHAR